MTDKRLEKQRTANKLWYDKHGDSLNQYRKTKYQNDLEYREKCIQWAREYRAGKERKVGKTRKLKGKIIDVLSIGEVADYAGTTLVLMRRWESRGHMPLPSFTGTHRVYTEGQQELIKMLADAYPVGDDWGAFKDFKVNVVAHVFAHWEDDI